MELKEIQQLNDSRGKRWHQGNLSQWSLLEWCGAMCGEAGEAANYAKKIRRLELELPNKEAGIDKTDLEILQVKLAKELADVIIYALLTMSTLGCDAEEIIKQVFNQKSDEYGFPEHL
jgi:NTP pyrophosphatase (non-canonical NTP hydrolase)